MGLELGVGVGVGVGVGLVLERVPREVVGLLVFLPHELLDLGWGWG